MSVNITLEDDEALVLFELLASKVLEPHVELPERGALWGLEACLEKELAEPFSPEYSSLLDRARKSLAEKFSE